MLRNFWHAIKVALCVCLRKGPRQNGSNLRTAATFSPATRTLLGVREDLSKASGVGDGYDPARRKKWHPINGGTFRRLCEFKRRSKELQSCDRRGRDRWNWRSAGKKEKTISGAKVISEGEIRPRDCNRGIAKSLGKAAPH
jgi:hypothetical protein